MATGESTQSVYSLGPSVSLDQGAPHFVRGELVLVRIPERIQVEGYVANEASAVGTNLPPASTGSSPQHFAFILNASLRPGMSWELEVYPVLSFTISGGALAAYNQMTDTGKAALLPLPPLSSRHPTPSGFGEPLDFGSWLTYKDSFLHVFPRWFTMTSRGPFKRMNPPLIMDIEDLYRIESYRESLLSTTSPQNHGDQSRPPPNGGNKDEQGSSNPLHGQTGDRAGLEKISNKSTHGLLALEDVDEDAEDTDATFLDELRWLAYDGDPVWMEELRKYLQKEEEENERMRNERAVRLAHWREDIAVQPDEIEA